MGNDMLYNNICKNKIVNIIFIHDYLQLVFENNGILNLYNKTTMPDDVGLLENKIVKDFILNDGCLKLILNNEICIEMSMKHEDYNGPEAWEYNNGDLIIVDS